MKRSGKTTDLNLNYRSAIISWIAFIPTVGHCLGMAFSQSSLVIELVPLKFLYWSLMTDCQDTPEAREISLSKLSISLPVFCSMTYYSIRFGTFWFVLEVVAAVTFFGIVDV